MTQLFNKLFNILLIILITFLVLHEYYIIEFSTSLRNVFLFLTLVFIILTSIKDIIAGKSGFSKFIAIIILFTVIVGGTLSVLNSTLNIFIYICLFFTMLQCFIDLIYNK